MLISQAEWARRRGFSRQYVHRLVKRGVVRLTDGGIDPAQADAALAALREPARPPRRRAGGRKEPVRAPGAGERDGIRPPAGARSDPFDPTSGGDLPTLLLKTRIKSEVERARLLEIKAKVEAGRYLDADEVEVAAFNKARILRDALLNIPDRLAAVLAAETDAGKVHAVLSAEIRTALEELSGERARG